MKLTIVVSVIRFSTLFRPGQYVPARLQGVILDTVVNVPLGRLYPGRTLVQLDTLLPDAALPVPAGHGMGATLDRYVPVVTVRLLIEVLVTRSRLRTFAAPGQYVFTGALVLHKLRSVTDEVLLIADVTAYPLAIDEHAERLPPEARFVVPVGQVSTTALALYTPDEATYAAANALGLISGFAEKAPTRPGQYVPAPLHCVTLAV